MARNIISEGNAEWASTRMNNIPNTKSKYLWIAGRRSWLFNLDNWNFTYAVSHFLSLAGRQSGSFLCLHSPSSCDALLLSNTWIHLHCKLIKMNLKIIIAMSVFLCCSDLNGENYAGLSMAMTWNDETIPIASHHLILPSYPISHTDSPYLLLLDFNFIMK